MTQTALTIAYGAKRIQEVVFMVWWFFGARIKPALFVSSGRPQDRNSGIWGLVQKRDVGAEATKRAV
jgi:hypothetical protein